MHGATFGARPDAIPQREIFVALSTLATQFRGREEPRGDRDLARVALRLEPLLSPGIGLVLVFFQPPEEIGECRPHILDRLLDDILGDFEHPRVGLLLDLVEQPAQVALCLLYTSPSPRDGLLSRMPSSA